MIKLEKVTKVYSDQEEPAVDNLSMEIKEGEVCVLVGPSGCGKTTTMKMINKLEEPNSGTIYVDGKDISTVNSIQLRLDIGYVIQEIGLFPHMTIADNVATVPREKKWPADQIRHRVDELMEMVGLPPKIYRQRKPTDLSGGQRQRVGVARAMAADPPILLMDEPFGAVDPITRARLQNEFLRIQEQMKKTIVFVTHDIDEAIKMGDKIAVMRRGKLVQYSSPDEILSSPADEFVSKLVGKNRSIKRLHLIKAESALDTGISLTVKSNVPVEEVEKVIEVSEIGVSMVVNGSGSLLGTISLADIREVQGIRTAGEICQPIFNTVDPGATLNDALSVMLNYGESFVAGLSTGNVFAGIITLGDLLELVKSDAA